MKQPLILALDQGTTSSRAIVFDRLGAVRSVAQQEFRQLYPADGRVEHDLEEIWSTTLGTARQAFSEAERSGEGEIVAIGITNQRETTAVWARDSGQPLHNAIVWQDRRTADHCRALQGQPLAEQIPLRTGLLLDPYFSATKIAWILENVGGARHRAEAGELAFGTVDSFLLWRLTGGRSHKTDVTNASRTSLFDIHAQKWDPELLDFFNVPASLLPEVHDCANHFGDTEADLFGRSIPILGIAGDQQSAAFGQACFTPGSIKSTYGTGCFVVLNTGDEALQSSSKLLTTVAYRLAGEVTYALEGSIFNAGTAIQWLRDEMGILSDAAESESLAESLPDNRGTYFVPAFTGLGAPHWDPDARGGLFGLTRATGRADLVRAALEAVCYQTGDLLSAMKNDGARPAVLRVDGGMAANSWAMQFLADILDLSVDRPSVPETTALGAAYLAGLQAGMYGSLDEIASLWSCDRRFEPDMADTEREQLMAGWQRAVERLKSAS